MEEDSIMGDSGLEEPMEDNAGLSLQYTPCLGMQFVSEDEGYDFYNAYGGFKGFSIRSSKGTKSRKDGIPITRKFVCSKEGTKEKDKRCLVVEKPRKDTRTKCGAKMCISFKRETSKWEVTKFEENHNHVLHIRQCAHMMRSQRKAQALNIADSGLSLKASHNLISAQSGGKEFVGFTRENQKTYLRTRREKSLEYGEAGALLEYFQRQAAQNPYFYYAVQLDVDEMITNIFWTDHEMIINYGHFGDAVSFDTTFCTNKEFRPFALFTGFNHYRMTTIFGAALLYDETTESFEWLFKTFLHVMSGKMPTTIFTDQDAAIAKAISIVMPNISHGLCVFHLNQNALKHLGHLFKGESNFGSEFNACMLEYEEENELLEAWNTLINKYNLHENTWMKKTWENRRKWAHVYMKWSFTTGMRSIQLSESLNAALKKCLKSDLNIVQFFTMFEKVVEGKRYEESKAIFNFRQKLPVMKLKQCPILNQVAELYTPPVFDLFHDEVDASLACVVKQHHEVEGNFRYVISKHGKNVKYLVVGNLEFDEFGNNSCRDISCTCRKFESFGILCGHVIKGLDRMGVMEIPERYVLGRWRLDAKDCGYKGKQVMVDENEPKLIKAARYRNLCPKMVHLATRSSELKAAYEFVNETVDYMCQKVDTMFLNEEESVEVGAEELDLSDPNFSQAKGSKKQVL